MYISVKTTSCNLHDILVIDITRRQSGFILGFIYEYIPTIKQMYSFKTSDMAYGLIKFTYFSSDMYYLNAIPILVTDFAVDLGVNIDSTLEFHKLIYV